MPSLRAQIVLICVVAGYFITVECRHTVTKDSYSPDILKKPHKSHSTLATWLKNLLAEGKLKRVSKPNAIKALITKLAKNDKINKKRSSKRNLRIGVEFQDFMHKLNHFINRNKHNYNYEKRDSCRFGFGNPAKCKRHKFRRHETHKAKNSHDKKKDNEVNFAQHMVVERAKYKSSSSSSSSEHQRPINKSRFKVVNNKRKKHQKHAKVSSESEEESTDYDDKQNDSEEKSNESDEKKNESYEKPDRSDEKFNEDSDAGGEAGLSEKSDESENEKSERESPDHKLMYLQGTRLQRPDFRSGRELRHLRRSDRIPYFLPKRFKWEDSMIHHLDAYWKVGINSYNSNKKYRTWYVW